MPIYTKTGDAGDTGLFDGSRVPKDDLRVEAYGTVDELNAALGLVRAEPLPHETDAALKTIQDELFDLGADLAKPGSAASVERLRASLTLQEDWIDRLMAALPPLRVFVLPAGHREAACLHVARTVCRRAERLVWKLAREVELPREIPVFLNRLSDLLFALAREANARHGIADVPWEDRKKKG
jgi:cob(I)alamin adenosyltransferase